ncbi:MAG: HIT family protein [Chloroflexi bacterium]|nr:HIT family protein [Chloroflexota bacterium]
MNQLRPFDLDAYTRRARHGPCFVCAIADGDPEYRIDHEFIYEDADVLVFLNRYPSLRGYTLVCPRRHVERVVDDLSDTEYLQLQRWVYRVGRAVEQVVPTERLYILSLGSQQGNRHVHWHVAPLPPGVAYADQQLAALRLGGQILAMPDEEMATLATAIRDRLLEELWRGRAHEI